MRQCLVGAIRSENTAKEPLNVARVVDTSPQRCTLSKIVDPDLVGSEISSHISCSGLSYNIHRELSSSQCTTNTRNMAVAGLRKDGQLAIRCIVSPSAGDCMTRKRVHTGNPGRWCYARTRIVRGVTGPWI